MLREDRDIAFEDVVLHISIGGILDTFEHPNQGRYPGQQIHVIEIEGVCLFGSLCGIRR